MILMVTHDRSGWSVSLSGDGSNVTGAMRNDGNGDKSGHVRVYQYSDITTQLGKIRSRY